MAYQTALVLNSGQPQQLQSGDLLTDRRFVDVYQSGFLNQTETSLSFNDSTYVFTLADAGAGWSYYRLGVIYTISGNKTVTLPGTPPAKGQYFIYIDATDGTLSQSTSPWTLQDGKIPVAIVTWDNAMTPKYYIQEERHSCLMDRRTHLYLHNTRGTQYITGGELTGYTLNTTTDAANTFAIGQSVIADEDIYLTLAAVTDGNGTDPTNYFVVYRNGAASWIWAYSDMPFSYTSSGYINWDSAGTLTQGTGGTGGSIRYYNTYLIFTNNAGAQRFVIIPGQNAHVSTAAAYAEVFANFTLTGLPIVEWVAVYQLTWQTGASGLTNKGKCQLTRNPQRITTSAITASATTPVAHNNLSGLQGGTTGEYYHLTSAETGKLVTNGDSHDHNGGDGAQISHLNLSNIGTNSHATIDTFISSKAAASGLASLDSSSLVVQNPANATATPTASKIPIAATTGKLAAGWLPVIISTTSYYVATTGNDTTGDGSSGSPWLTLAKAINTVNALLVIPTTVTIYLGDGEFSFSSALPTPKYALTITGTNTYAKTCSSIVSSSGSAGAYSVVLQLNTVTNIAVGDWVQCTAATGGTSPLFLMGFWEVTAVDTENAQITVTSTSYAGVPSGSVAATVTVIKTILTATGCTAFSTAPGAALTLGKMAVIGDLTSSVYGATIRTGGRLALSSALGFALWRSAIIAEQGGVASLAGVTISGCDQYPFYALNSCKILAAGCVLTGNGPGSPRPVFASYASFVDISGGWVIGNAGNVQAYYGSVINAANAIVTDNTTYDLYAAQRGYINASGATAGVLSPAANTLGNEEGYINT